MTAGISDLLSGFEVPENNPAIACSRYNFFPIRPKCDARDVTFGSFENALPSAHVYIPKDDVVILVPECEFFSIGTEGDIGPGTAFVANERFLLARGDIE